MSFDDDLDTQSYEIEDELKIRKILEQETEWTFEFTKNDKYDYDLELYRWQKDANSPDDRELFGYVELERARADREKSWITGDPRDQWYFVSFLKRKVYDWDYSRGCWGSVNSDYEQTVYLKFNHAMDCCVIAPLEAIYRDGEETKNSDGSRTNSYLALEFDHPDLHIGISESAEFIDEYLNRRDNSQAGLDSFAWGESDE